MLPQDKERKLIAFCARGAEARGFVFKLIERLGAQSLNIKNEYCRNF